VSFFEELKRRNVFRVGVAYAVVAWVIIQVVDVVAPSMALPEWVPGFVILMLAIGAPVALLFAWAYEITPEGLRKTEQVDEIASITRQTGRKIDRLIIGGLTVLVAFLLVDRFLLAPTAAGGRGGGGASDASIAVLPFANLSGDPNEEYFSDGISEELLNVLAQIPDLRVAARTSSFQFKNDNRDITEIARALNVAHVLEGSVRRSGDDVRITAQLISADDGYHLWSDTYTRDGSDIFAVQDEISGHIVRALREELQIDLAPTVARDVTTENRAAHEAYLRGRHLVVQRTRATIEGAVREFERSIELDPEYAPAHAELALAVNFLASNQYGDLTNSEVIERTEPLAARALELDPNLAEAHAAQGFVSWSLNDLEGARRSMERALEINPNYAAAHNWIGNILTDGLGEYAEGLERTWDALERDPLSIPALANTTLALYDLGRAEEASALVEDLGAIAPAFAFLGRAGWAGMNGRLAEAARLRLEGLDAEPGSVRLRNGLAGVLQILGFEDDAGRLDPTGSWIPFRTGAFEVAKERHDLLMAADPDDPFALSGEGILLAARGDAERARAVLDELWDGPAAGRITRNGIIDPFAALALAWARAETGGDAEEILDALRRHQERVADAGLRLVDRSIGALAIAEYMVGDRPAALAALADAGAGWQIPEGTAFLADFDADPEVQALREARGRLVAAERAALLAELCGTDHPGEDVWTPSAEACGAGDD
jgi:TolB-like protein/tetratricopeptide (TPR) repeat protein